MGCGENISPYFISNMWQRSLIFFFVEVTEDSSNNISGDLIIVFIASNIYYRRVSASPYLKSATIKEHIRKFKNEYPETLEILATCLYVNDLVSGTFVELVVI